MKALRIALIVFGWIFVVWAAWALINLFGPADPLKVKSQRNTPGPRSLTGGLGWN